MNGLNQNLKVSKDFDGSPGESFAELGDAPVKSAEAPSFGATVLKMMGVMLIGTFGFVAALFSIIFRSSSTPIVLTILICCAGIAVTAVSIWGVIRLNNQWKNGYSAKFSDETDTLLAYWKVPIDIWVEFTDEERKKSAEDWKGAGMMIGVILGVVTFLWVWFVEGFLLGLAWGLGVGLVLGLYCHGMICVRELIKYRWRRAQLDEVEVWVRTDGMRINQKLIPWNQFQSRLESVRLDRETGGNTFDVFEAVVSARTHRNRIEHEHRVALPVENRDTICQAIEILKELAVSRV